jgi:23S rRNA G2069 N7-methylase RlmK/C1962 C5-methylase RlmI
VSELGNRLKKNAKRLAPWLKRHDITCYRLYDRDLPQVPLAIDLYEGRMQVSVFEPRHGIDEATVAAWVSEASGVISPAHTVVKRRASGALHEKKGESGADFIVRESGLRFIVNLDDYLDTGLFLDHRITRALVRAESSGKRVLNLFAYTGAFSVYAAAGGAAHVTTVDLSPTYARWCERNFAENALPAGTIVVADAVSWLENTRATFDLIVIDPPTVSKSKRADSFDVQTDHVNLITAALAHAASGAAVWFSTNFQGFTLDERAILRHARVVDEKTSETVPLDFPHKPPIHRSWRIEK